MDQQCFKSSLAKENPKDTPYRNLGSSSNTDCKIDFNKYS